MMNISRKIAQWISSDHRSRHAEFRLGDLTGCAGAVVSKDVPANAIVGRVPAKIIKLGDNVTIGAGSVVTKDIPSDEVWAGNPAKFIKAYTCQSLRE